MLAQQSLSRSTGETDGVLALLDRILGFSAEAGTTWRFEAVFRASPRHVKIAYRKLWCLANLPIYSAMIGLEMSAFECECARYYLESVEVAPRHRRKHQDD